MKKHLKSILTLFAICAIVSVALAVVNDVTAPEIAKKQKEEAMKAVVVVLPGADAATIKEVDLSKYEGKGLPESIKAAYEDPTGLGFVIQVEFSGFEKGNVAMIGVSADGKVTGTKIITNNESAGFGADHLPKLDEANHYGDSTVDTIDGVDTVSGCTVSSRAYRAAVKDALNAAIVLSGARTADQIFSDNLNTALGTTNGEFEKLVLTDDVVGVNAMYIEKNGAGYVVEIEGNFIGVNMDDEIVASVDEKTNVIEITDEVKETAIAAVSSVKNVTYTDIDLSQHPSLPAGIASAQVSNKGVYIIVVDFKGFSEGNKVEVTIADGKVIATKCLVNNDTPSYGGAAIPELDANGHFNGATVDTIDGVDTIAGVTVSTEAYRNAIKSALQAAAMFAGEEVDTRTPEEILNDNLNAALGVEGVEFEKHFFMEVVEGVDAIYLAKTGEGHVVVIGEQFFGFDTNGNPVGETNDVAVTAVATIKATTYTVIEDPRAYGASKRVKSALVTNGGVYVLEVEGAGFGKNGDSHYHPSGEYIVIKIAITADGQILDCYTVYQSETEGFGDKCADEEFYGQFVGKDKDSYKDIVISGATMTTNGYHSAINNALKAVAKFVEGGAN